MRTRSAASSMGCPRVKPASERGASAVEYGLLVAGIAALIVAVVFAFGGVIEGVFNDTCDQVGAANGTAC